MRLYFTALMMTTLLAAPAALAQNTTTSTTILQERPADIVNEYISPEDGFLQGASMFCLTPLIGDGDVAAHALREGLPELDVAAASALDANGGRAFGFPPYPQDQAVIVRPGVGCSVVIRAVDFARLVTAADAYFSPQSPYRLLDEQIGADGSLSRVYGAEMDGPVTLYLSVHAAQPANGVQAMITIVRRPSTAAQ